VSVGPADVRVVLGWMGHDADDVGDVAAAVLYLDRGGRGAHRPELYIPDVDSELRGQACAGALARDWERCPLPLERHLPHRAAAIADAPGRAPQPDAAGAIPPWSWCRR
jgi:hypothetical protein